MLSMLSCQGSQDMRGERGGGGSYPQIIFATPPPPPAPNILKLDLRPYVAFSKNLKALVYRNMQLHEPRFRHDHAFLHKQ